MTVENSLVAAALIASACLAVSLPSLALAETRTKHETVTVIGDFPDQKITMPVRKTANGMQVRLPHGAWVYCGADCSQTLKDQTFSFWTEEEEHTGVGVTGR